MSPLCDPQESPQNTESAGLPRNRPAHTANQPVYHLQDRARTTNLGISPNPPPRAARSLPLTRLRFQCYDIHTLNEGKLRHAHAINRDGKPITSAINRDGNIITLETEERGPLALALMWHTKDAGDLVLQTTILPERERPYLLELELTRHRIMQAYVKLEDWQLSAKDVTASPALAALNDAQQHFTKALCAGSPTGEFSTEQATHATDALANAIKTSEDLAHRAAELDLLARFEDLDKGKHDDPAETHAGDIWGPVPSIGVTTHHARFAPPLARVVQQAFDFINVPIRWNEIEKEEGRVDYRAHDRWIEAAVKHTKQPVVAGPVLDLADRALPDWLAIWEHDYDTMREFAYEHVDRVVKRYRKAISRWVLLSGPTAPASGIGALEALPPDNNHLATGGVKLTIDQWVDLARLASLAVSKAAPAAETIIEIQAPFGEIAQGPNGQTTSTSLPTSDPPILNPAFFAEMLIHAGIKFDALGLRLQFAGGTADTGTRDLLQLSAIIDAFSEFEKPLHITALGCPSEPTTPLNPATDPGHWHSNWNEQTQADFLTEAVAICASKPAVQSICWQALYDAPELPDMPTGGLVTKEGKAKPALKALDTLRRSLKAHTITRPPAKQPTPA